MARVRNIKRSPNGRFASAGKQMAIRMPARIRNSTKPSRSNRAIRASKKG